MTEHQPKQQALKLKASEHKTPSTAHTPDSTSPNTVFTNLKEVLSWFVDTQREETLTHDAFEILVAEAQFYLHKTCTLAMQSARRSHRIRLLPLDVHFATRRYTAFPDCTRASHAVADAYAHKGEVADDENEDDLEHMAHWHVRNGKTEPCFRTHIPGITEAADCHNDDDGLHVDANTDVDGVAMPLPFVLPKRLYNTHVKIHAAASAGKFSKVAKVIQTARQKNILLALTPYLCQTAYKLITTRRTDKAVTKCVLYIVKVVLSPSSCDSPASSSSPSPLPSTATNESLQFYAPQLLAALLSLIVTKRLGQSETSRKAHVAMQSDFDKRAEAARLLHVLVTQVGTAYPTVLGQVHAVVMAVFRRPDEFSLNTHVGALRLLVEFGEASVAHVLVPRLSQYLAFLQGVHGAQPVVLQKVYTELRSALSLGDRLGDKGVQSALRAIDDILSP